MDHLVISIVEASYNGFTFSGAKNVGKVFSERWKSCNTEDNLRPAVICGCGMMNVHYGVNGHYIQYFGDD